MEFELKLAKEKEEMHEREKQLKISRLVQEVCGGGAEEQALSSAAYIGYFIDQRANMREGLDSCCVMLPGSDSVPGFRDGEGRLRGVRKGAALGGASMSDTTGADLVCGE